MSKRKKTKSRKPSGTGRSRKRGQLGLPLGDPDKWRLVGGKLTGGGIVCGRPETFPDGMAMSESGWPVFSLAVKHPHAKAGPAITREMARREEAAARKVEIKRQAQLIEIDKPMGGERLDLKWAKGLLQYLPRDMRGLIEQQADAMTQYHVGWMDGFDDYHDESEKARGFLLLGIEAGLAFALARFREPLMKHAPAARKLIVTLDDNRKRGTEATKAKPVKARDRLRELMATASDEGREVTVEEIMKTLKCSRTTAWRRKTEIDLEPRR